MQAVKANLRLNTKRLYTANGLAVQELSKAVSLLHQASQAAQVDGAEREELSELSIRTRMSEYKKSRQLASEITFRGADLHDELAKEHVLRVSSTELIADCLHASGQALHTLS